MNVSEFEPQFLDPKKIDATAHQMVTLLYEGFVSMGDLLKQCNTEKAALKEENQKLQARVNGLLDKLLSGDEDGKGKESPNPNPD